MTRYHHINVHGERCIRPNKHNNSHHYLFQAISEEVANNIVNEKEPKLSKLEGKD